MKIDLNIHDMAEVDGLAGTGTDVEMARSVLQVALAAVPVAQAVLSVLAVHGGEPSLGVEHSVDRLDTGEAMVVEDEFVEEADLDRTKLRKRSAEAPYILEKQEGVEVRVAL